MPDLAKAERRTRIFARVIGPFLVFVSATVVYQIQKMGLILTDFFTNGSFVWVTGAWIFLLGMIIIASHQYWRSLAAFLVSLLGWLLVIRGAILMLAPNLVLEFGETAIKQHVSVVQIGFGVMILIGLYLSYVGWIAGPHIDADADRS